MNDTKWKKDKMKRNNEIKKRKPKKIYRYSKLIQIA